MRKLTQYQLFSGITGSNIVCFEQREFPNLIFVQDNISISQKNVLRGLHGNLTATKLAECVFGEVLLAVCDIRISSSGFGTYELFNLSAENRNRVLIPAGFVNGHLCLSEQCVFYYKWSEYYTPDQITIRWDDPTLNIPWGITNPILSERDRHGISIQTYKCKQQL